MRPLQPDRRLPAWRPSASPGPVSPVTPVSSVRPRPGRRLVRLAGLALLATLRPAGAAGVNSVRLEDLYVLARSFEVQALVAAPDWSRAESPPLLRFAWMSDFHLDGGERLPMIRAACRTVRDTVRPHFAILTGDNSAYDPTATSARAALPQSLRRQLAFKDFLDTELDLPVAILPGDNWHRNAEKVFGPTRFSFNAAGLHLVFLSPDRKASGVEGCDAFDPPTWEWLARDLEAHRARATLVILHENVVPPTFLDAPRLERLLLSQPQVLATLSGHLHLDLEFRRGGLTHFVCPSLAPGARPGFKVVALYPDRLVLNTWEYDAAAKTFRSTLKWQRLDLPDGELRRALQPVDTTRILREDRREMPALPLLEDTALLQRQGELVMPLLQFVMERGAQTLAP